MIKRITILFLTTCFSSIFFAGNPSRVGEAGASLLVTNPWARSSGMAGANISSINGAQAIEQNVAGVVFIKNTDFSFSNQIFLVGTSSTINSFGFVQKIKENNAIAISIINKSYGFIETTNENNPDGLDFGVNVSELVVNTAFTRKFSEKIAVGLNIKLISQSTDQLSSTGFGFDGGIRYTSGKYGRSKFGITLRNVGPTTNFTGDGLSIETVGVSGSSITATQKRKSAFYELPVQLNIGFSYDFFLTPALEDPETKKVSVNHKLNVSSTFSANAFSSDQLRLGLEYSLKDKFFLRGGYFLLTSEESVSGQSESAYTGPSGGLSFKVPFGRQGRLFMIDYSYQVTKNFSGTHSIGLQLSL